ncbi:MAG: T9SS type A sorting domain-containing protein [Flavobacteriales bacterium]
MPSRAILIFTSLLACVGSNAQVFDRYYGGEGAEKMGAMVRTPDGGYLIAGSSSSFTSFGLGLDPPHSRTGYVVKTNGSGIPEWSFTLGDTIHLEYVGIALRDDGGYMLVGKTQFISSDPWRIVLAHITTTGELVWCKEIRAANGIQLLPRRFLASGDDEYLITGEIILSGAGTGFNSDQMAIKVNGDGDILWSVRHGMNTMLQFSRASDAVKLNNGGYLVCGARNFGVAVQLVSMDASGNYLWDRTHASQVFYGEPRMARVNGRVVLMGDHMSGPLVMKMDDTGEVLWQHVYAHEQLMQFPVFDAWENGEIVLAATIQGEPDGIVIVHLDPEGVVLSATRYGPDDRSIRAEQIVAHPDGSITLGYTSVVAGETFLDMGLVHLESTEDGYLAPCDHEPTTVESLVVPPLSDSSVMTSNPIISLTVTDQAWVTTSNGASWPVCINVEVVEANGAIHGPELFPNPTTGSFTIELIEESAVTITDLLGAVVLQRTIGSGRTSLELPRSGMYLVHIRSEAGTTIRKLLVDR